MLFFLISRVFFSALSQTVNDHKEQPLLEMWGRTEAPRFWCHSAWFIPLMLSDIYRLWPANCILDGQLTFLLPLALCSTSRRVVVATVRFPCCYSVAWFRYSEKKFNMDWKDKPPHHVISVPINRPAFI